MTENEWVLIAFLLVVGLVAFGWRRYATSWNRRVAAAEAEANSAYDRGDYAEAEDQYRLSLEIAEEALGPEHPGVAERRNYLTHLIRKRGQVEVISAKQEMLLNLEKDLGAEHPDVAKALSDMGILHIAHNNTTDAMRCYERALGIQERVLGPDNPEVAVTLNNLGLLHRTQEKYEDTKELYNRALAIREKTLPPEHPDLTVSLSNLALLYADQGDYARAEPFFRKLLEIEGNSFGSENPVPEGALESYAVLLRETGRIAEAEALEDRVRTIQTAGPKETGYDVFAEEAWGLHMAASEQAYKRDDITEAASELEAAVKKAEELGPEDPRLAMTLNNLAELYRDQGKYAKAEPLFERSLAIAEKALGPEHPDVATSIENYAAVLSEAGRTNEATDLEARAKAIRAKHARQNPEK